MIRPELLNFGILFTVQKVQMIDMWIYTKTNAIYKFVLLGQFSFEVQISSIRFFPELFDPPPIILHHNNSKLFCR